MSRLSLFDRDLKARAREYEDWIDRHFEDERYSAGASHRSAYPRGCKPPTAEDHEQDRRLNLPAQRRTALGDRLRAIAEGARPADAVTFKQITDLTGMFGAPPGGVSTTWLGQNGQAYWYARRDCGVRMTLDQAEALVEEFPDLLNNSILVSVSEVRS
jgi:hypothetical protein